MRSGKFWSGSPAILYPKEDMEEVTMKKIMKFTGSALVGAVATWVIVAYVKPRVDEDVRSST